MQVRRVSQFSDDVEERITPVDGFFARSIVKSFREPERMGGARKKVKEDLMLARFGVEEAHNYESSNEMTLVELHAYGRVLAVMRRLNEKLGHDAELKASIAEHADIDYYLRLIQTPALYIDAMLLEAFSGNSLSKENTPLIFFHYTQLRDAGVASGSRFNRAHSQYTRYMR